MVIYKVTNNINNKIYVGQKTGDISEYLGSGKLIQRAVKKYGKDNFSFEILETIADSSKLNERETFWIQKLKSYLRKIGYNISNTSFGGDTISRNPDRNIICDKISKSAKKRYHNNKVSILFLEQQGKIADRGVFGEYECSKCLKIVKGKSNYLRYHEDNCGKLIEQVTCPHCNKTGRLTGMILWHFNKCKNNPENII